MTKTAIAAVLALCILVMPLREALANEWRVSSKVDPFTDNQNVVALLSSSKGAASALAVTCKDKVLSMGIGHEMALDADMPVTTRVGREAPVTQPWIEGRHEVALFHPDPGAVLTALSWAKDHTFAVRVWAWRGTNLDSIFDMSKVDSALDAIMGAGCDRDIVRRLDPSELEPRIDKDWWSGDEE